MPILCRIPNELLCNADTGILVTKVLTKSDVEMKRIVLPRLAVQSNLLPTFANKKGPNDVVSKTLNPGNIAIAYQLLRLTCNGFFLLVNHAF